MTQTQDATASDAERVDRGEDPWTLAMTPDERDAYERWVQSQQDLMKTRARRRCYECRPVTGRIRRVTGTFVTGRDFDPTTAYRLVCGHDTIDC